MKRTRSKNWGTPEDNDGNVVNVNVREFIGTSAAGLCHVKSVQPSVFSHTSWQSWVVTITSRQSTQSNQTSGKISPVMTPLWVAVGLRRIWWFLLYNFRMVSRRLYLQLDTSDNPTSHVSPVWKADKIFHITTSLFNFPPAITDALVETIGWNTFRCTLAQYIKLATNICSTQNICIHSIWWRMQWLCNKSRLTLILKPHVNAFEVLRV